MIEIQNINKTYRMGDNVVEALKDVSLTIEDGDFVAIMGPSGSGKSTLAHILGLLDVPTSGSYRLHGSEVSQLNEDDLAILRRNEIGFIFQQFNLLPKMTAFENVILPNLYTKNEQGPIYATQLLERVGLSTRQAHRPNELSGGQQQRVAIARALINKPKIILADEPTGNLDSNSEKEIMTILKELNAQGITIIMVTHEDEIGEQANRLIRMRDGLIQSDKRKNEFSKSLSESKSSFIARTSLQFKEVIEYFKQGIKTLLANKIRTGLSMLGILIGVSAVVTMLALGQGAQKAIEAQLSSLGSNLLVLRTGAIRVAGVAQESGANTKLSIDDANILKERIPTIRALSANVSGRAQVTFLNKNWSTTVNGTSAAYSTMRAFVPRIGRFFSEEENKKRVRVAAIGTTVVKELFGTQNPMGEMIKINKIPFQIVGVLPDKGASGWRDENDVILIPTLTAMHRLLGKEYLDSIDIEVINSTSIDTTQNAILNLLYEKKKVPLSQHDNAFMVQNMAEIQEAFSETNKTMSVLLASIASISLLVGGIGIMNIMLVSVTERTKEIGLRKAIGAKKQDILLQFLAEAIVVSLIGGTIGIILGCLASFAISYFSNWSTSVSAASIVISFSFSAFIGVVFGIYPAKKASLLHPIDALRYE